MSGPDPNYYRQLRPELLPFVPERRAKVLDIGCGEGAFSRSLTNVSERWGIEPQIAAAEKALLDKVLIGTFADVRHDLPKGYFDLVVANDVIEHMPDHDWFLEEIKPYIAPGGALMGSLPNVRYYDNLFQLLFAKDWAYEASGILDRTHLRFFTERSARRTLEAHGYRINTLRGINSGIKWRRSKAEFCSALMACGIIALSLTTARDIRHLQFAFVAEP